MDSFLDPRDFRSADFPIEEIFLRRWSPRAMSGAPIDVDVLNSLFEAARWAPSTYNEQEWRFLYAQRDSSDWNALFDLLMEANQLWCRNAGALILVLSKKTLSRNGKPNPVHSLDTGMAVQNLLLQAASMPGIVAHPMAGFDRGKAPISLRIPADYTPECMIAVGHAGSLEMLPEPLRSSEKVTGRKPVRMIAKAGPFDFPE